MYIKKKKIQFILYDSILLQFDLIKTNKSQPKEEGKQKKQGQLA